MQDGQHSRRPVTLDELEDRCADAYRSGSREDAEALRSAFESTPASAGPRSDAVRGGAALILFKLDGLRTDLEHAVELLGESWNAEPTPTRAVNYASALLETAGLEPDAVVAHDIVKQAVGMLNSVIVSDNAAARTWVNAMTTLLTTQLEQLQRLGTTDEIRTAVTRGEELLTRAAEAQEPTGTAQNIVGCLLLAAAEHGDEIGDLDRARDLLQAATGSVPESHVDLPAWLSNLGSIEYEIYVQHGGLDHLQASIQATARAFDLMDEGNRARPLIANNLINGFVQMYEETGSIKTLGGALLLVPFVLKNIPETHALRATALNNVALCERHVGLAMNEPSMLDEAIEHHKQAIRSTPSGQSEWIKGLAGLSVGLAARFHRDGEVEDLETAIEAAETALSQSADAARHDTVAFGSNLANLYHDRYLRTGRISDLDRAARLHLDGLHTLGGHHPLVPALQNNAGIALLDRFERFGDPDDLEAATNALSVALGATPAGHPDRPARLINLATALQARFRELGNPDDLRMAHALASESGREAHAASDLSAANGTRLNAAIVLALEFDDIAARAELEAEVETIAQASPASSAREQLRRGLLLAISDSPMRATASALISAGHRGLEEQPGIALEASAQVLFHILRRGTCVEDRNLASEAEQIGKQALEQLTVGQADRRYELAWRHQATGWSALVAQHHLLNHAPQEALDVFNAGHGAMLTGALRNLDNPSAVTVTVWATAYGGGAVVRQGRDLRDLHLPMLQSRRISRWHQRIVGAARLSSTLLDQVLPSMLQQMGDAYVNPILEHALADQSVTWCAGGLLQDLPIAAVPSETGCVIDRHGISFASNERFAAWSESATLNGRVDFERACSVAAPSPSSYPPLVGAAQEGAEFAPARSRFLGGEATSAQVLRGINEASLLHIASHARVDATDPYQSHFLLAHDEALTADSIMSQHSYARLAVLSACDTAVPGDRALDERLGLAAAFHATGIPGVIATLWPVRDQQTLVFMRLLAKHLREADPIEALRKTQRSFAAERASIASWAGYVLSGM